MSNDVRAFNRCDNVQLHQDTMECEKNLCAESCRDTTCGVTHDVVKINDDSV